jgi:ribonuclease P protein component
MQSRFRLSEDKRFSEIHQEGLSVANNLLVVRILKNELDYNRYGFMVSKRLGNAVTRNRIRRRLREVVRMAQLKNGWDAVFIVRKGAENANYDQLKSAAENVLRRAHLLSKDCEKEKL